MTRIKLLMIFVGVYFSRSAAGEIVTPIQALFTVQMYQIGADNSRVLLEEQKGIFLRRPDGSELRRTKTYRDGEESGPDVALLLDTQARSVYRIEHHSKKAVVRQELPEGYSIRLSARKPPEPERIIGEESVGGVRCKLVAGKNHPARHNLACISFEYDLLVRTEHEFTTPEGARFYQVTSLSEIQTGAEPDAELFSVPSGYEVLVPEDLNQRCARCERGR
jgi:hypothetical protein